jgi:cation diffusion facilitator CzcD-associated flavoprotein CzcO
VSAGPERLDTGRLETGLVDPGLVDTGHVDVLIVGAGLSGIGAGHQLQERFPGKTYLIIEDRQDLGGTWSLFRYPGVRSDSDMHTLGYRFRPWTDGKAIADGPSILSYLRATAEESGVIDHIRFGRRAVRAEWSSEDARWTVQVRHVDSGATTQLTCSFLFMCAGYFRYDEGYLPDFAGVEQFQGRIVHPQQWPDDLDYAGKRVVVVGSGATAITLVPAMAKDAASVTMLQRSPSYVVSLPGTDRLAKRLQRLLPAHVAYRLVRWKNIARMAAVYGVSRRAPDLMRGVIRRAQERQLPEAFDIDTHFTPRYDPWDQRLCIAENGDLFRSLRNGSASIVTGEIETFTERGLRLVGGTEIDADVIVTATGLNLLVLGGLDLAVDGRDVDIPSTTAYKALMLSDVPNLAFALGYTNASWTLKIDLTYSFVWRLLEYMDDHRLAWCVPRLRDPSIRPQPFMDFQAGYVLRSINDFPRSGSKAPWRLRMSYLADLLTLSRGSIDDGTMEFGPVATTAVRSG